MCANERRNALLPASNNGQRSPVHPTAPTPTVLPLPGPRLPLPVTAAEFQRLQDLHDRNVLESDHEDNLSEAEGQEYDQLITRELLAHPDKINQFVASTRQLMRAMVHAKVLARVTTACLNSQIKERANSDRNSNKKYQDSPMLLPAPDL
ncbi:hypothetical protein HKX48_001827, partial [Thoreauomyces humboldtii]